MPTDRVLVEIVTASNMRGVEAAKAGLLGFNPLVLATGLALGGLVEASKAAIEISREHFRAEENLANAIKNRRDYHRGAINSLEQFMQTNRDFISNQNEVINSYANLIREGVKTKDLSRLMTIALNIQATQGGTLADSVLKIQQAEVGRNRGLALAVGLTLKAIPAHATLAEKQKLVAYNLRVLEKAYKDGTKAVDPLTRASNNLKTSWEKIAEIAGPELLGVLAQVTQAGADFLTALGDPKSYTAIDDRLTKMARGLRAIALQLGIAQPDAAEKAGSSGKRDPLAGLSPSARAAYIKAFPQYGAAAARGDAVNAALAAAAQARKNALWQAEMLQHQKEYLYWLKSMSFETHHMAMDIRAQSYKPIIVKLDAVQIANQIRIAERRLR